MAGIKNILIEIGLIVFVFIVVCPIYLAVSVWLDILRPIYNYFKSVYSGGNKDGKDY